MRTLFSYCGENVSVALQLAGDRRNWVNRNLAHRYSYYLSDQTVIQSGSCMPPNKSSDAFTGLEAAIVLIAFVVVAAVFSYVILGAGFYTSQKSQETVYKGMEQASTNIQMIGQVYGIASAPANGINEIKFTIGLAPGAPSIDLRSMTIVYASANSTTLQILTHANETTAVASQTEFTSKVIGRGDNVNSLSGTQQMEIDFKVPILGASETMNIEIRPAVGASLPFSKSAPATIKAINILA